MKTKSLFTALSLVFLCVVANAHQSDFGQRTDQQMAGSETSMQAKDEKQKVAPKLTGRLPRYFASVVSPEQRQEIYRIQNDYRKQIEQLQRQLEDLRLAELDEVTQVLSESQKRQVETRRAAASKRVNSKRTNEKAKTN